jgi:hypothetical protein
MGEHDDDLEPRVREEAEQETEAYSNTGDEVDSPAADEAADEDDDQPLDEDPPEI